MSDIFISYSRKDSEHALALTERLRAEGMTVWIDLHGLELASSWSREIVEAIEQCKAFLLLLSETALTSKNIIREVTIASECGRPIIPVEIKHVRLTSDFKYALAGLQRAPLADFDAIIRSLARAGVGVASTASPEKPEAPRTSKPKEDAQKTLLVLPFVDLSQGRDNEWFADGLTEELIDTLSNIKSIRVIDRKTAMGFKDFRGTPKDIARDLGVRYFIQGSVRRAGDTVKITAQVLDVDTGDHLSAVSHKGTMHDIFEIQEDVARKIAAALELKLTRQESDKLASHITSNPEAYQLYLGAKGLHQRQAKESIANAISMLETALELEPQFSDAHSLRSYFLLDYYRLYGAGLASLAEIEAMLHADIARRPDTAEIHAHLCYCYQLQERYEEGEREAKRAIALAPDSHVGMDALAFLYAVSGRTEEAAAVYEKSLPLYTLAHRMYFNLYVMYSSLNDPERLRDLAQRGIPEFERWLRLHPDDFNERVSYCVMLFGAGREQEAREAADALRNTVTSNGKAFFNLSCFYLDLQEKEAALDCLRKAIAAGFRNRGLFMRWKESELFTDNAELDQLLADLN